MLDKERRLRLRCAAQFTSHESSSQGISICAGSPSPSSHRERQRGPDDSYTHSEVHYRRGGLNFSSVQSLSRVWLFMTPWTAAHQASLSIANSGSLLKLMSIKSVMPYNHLTLCHPLFLLPSIFSNQSVLHIRWPKHWSFSFCISPSNEYSGSISFRIDWFDLLEIQGTLRSLLQHHSSKAPILWRWAFFMVQLSHLYMTTGKMVALTIQTFVGKVMSLLFNTLGLS